MATTFFKQKLGGKLVILTSFYGGIRRGRCIQISIEGNNKEINADTVTSMRPVLHQRISQRRTYYLGCGDKAVMLNKKDMRTFDAALAKWESGEPLRDII